MLTDDSLVALGQFGEQLQVEALVVVECPDFSEFFCDCEEHFVVFGVDKF